jgi:twitching motility protein PilI
MITDYFHLQLRQEVSLLIPMTNTVEVISQTRGEICPLPGVSPNLLGVVNQRGRLLWVLELSDLLGLEQKEIRSRSQDKLTILIITSNSSTTSALDEERPKVGCVVSRLQGIVSLDSESFEPLPNEFQIKSRAFLEGVTAINNSPAAVLNVPALLADIQTPITA